MQTGTRALALAGAGVGTALGWLRGRRQLLDLRGRSVLITGGSRGLGLLMARAFAAEGARITLVARDEGELERAQLDLADHAKSVTALVAGDIADERTARRAVDVAVKAHGGLDVLVNNAGVIQVGPLETITYRDFEQSMGTHFWGAYYMTMAALPQLRRNGQGRIVNITSIGGVIAIPHMLPYTASKFAMVGLSDGLRAELASAGIKVTTVIPGLMRTGSHMNARFKGQHRQEFTWFALAAALPIASSDAERAARRIVRACQAGTPHLVITWQARAAMLAQALAPGLTARITALAARALPGAPAQGGRESYSGWESQSRLAPSPLTSLADQAAARFNEKPLDAEWLRRDE